MYCTDIVLYVDYVRLTVILYLDPSGGRAIISYMHILSAAATQPTLE